jgi:predicted histidine transporter YuiF (NhaC family)
MLGTGVNVTTVALALLAAAGIIGRIVTVVQEHRARREYEAQRRADRERIIAQQDRIAEMRRQERQGPPSAL